MKHLNILGRGLAIGVFVLTFLGCTKSDMDKLPQVKSAFTYTQNPDTGTVTFINVSEGARTYIWDFGDGTKSEEIDPIKTYESSGTYKVTLVASNQAGASNTFEDELVVSLKRGVSLPITFDETDVIYDPSTFEGAAFRIVANPDVSGSNDKETNVGEITNGGTAFEGLFFDLETPVDLTTEKTITMNFWSEIPIDVLMKLEEGTGAAAETSASHGGTGWEEIAFDFTSSSSYSRLTLFVDGPGTTAGIFYFDDVEQAGTDPGGDDCTAETEQSLDASDFNLTFQTDPGTAIIGDGAAYSYIDNPDTENDVNPSCKAGQIDRDPSLPFANSQIVFDSKFDFNTNEGFKLKVWAPVAGTNVLLKLEDKSNSAVNTEVGAVTTTGNAWEELTFDFSGAASDTYDKIVLFFDINTDSGATYYIDDFALYSDGGGATCTSETSQSLSAADFDLTFQSDPGSLIISDGSAYSYIDNPDFDNAINPSCKVGQLDRDPGLPFANNQIVFDSKFDFNANAGFKLKVWAPVAGTNVLLKLEDKTNGAINTEVGAVTTTGNAWEELTFDFPASASDTYDKIVLFFDITTNIEATYYIDDFRVYGTGGGGPSCVPETSQSLDASNLDITFQTDPGAFIESYDAVYSFVSNPDFDNAVNPSCQVGQIDRSGSALFANNQMVFDSKFDFNAYSGFKIKVWSPVAGTNVLLKLEDKTNGAINTEVGAVTTTASAWEELTFDFPSSETDKYDRIILFFELNTNTAQTYYIDDFRLYSGGGTGPGNNGCTSGTLVAATQLPLDFEGCETFLSDQNFGAGLTSEINANPSNLGIHPSDFVLQVDPPPGSDFFAGIQNVFPSNFDLTTTNTFKIKIYSTKANAVFRFELLANPNDGSIGNPAPVFATVSNANEWTEVEFTFTGLPAGPTAYSQLVIKPDNDQTDSPITNGGTYYLDDLRLE